MKLILANKTEYQRQQSHTDLILANEWSTNINDTKKKKIIGTVDNENYELLV